MKVCRVCEIPKPLNAFLKNKQCREGRAGICSECDTLYKRSYYKANVTRKRALANLRLQANKRHWVLSKGDKCHDCEERFEDCVYDFHHMDGYKDMNPSRASSMSINNPVAIDEMQKCILLCANCHRVRHFGKSDQTDRKVGPDASID